MEDIRDVYMKRYNYDNKLTKNVQKNKGVTQWTYIHIYTVYMYCCGIEHNKVLNTSDFSE